MRGKSIVKKSRVVNAIKMGFILFSKGYELVLFMEISSIANDIGRSIIHTTIDFSSRAEKNYKTKVNMQWSYYSSLIVDKVSMISLKLLTSMDKQLYKTQEMSPNSTTVFDGLFLVILIDDFYQFVPVQARFLWNNLVENEKLHKKSFWDRFISLLTLAE